MSRTYLTLLLASAAALLAPVALSLYGSLVAYDWRASPRFDGRSYLMSTYGYEAAEADSTGVAAVLATLSSWNGAPANEAEVHEDLQEAGFAARLSDLTAAASARGLQGQWLQAEAGALAQLKRPFVAHMRDSGGRMVIVRDVRGGYVHVTDPQRGNLLYPLASFTDAWTGQLFAFPDPPAQPEEWR